MGRWRQVVMSQGRLQQVIAHYKQVLLQHETTSENSLNAAYVQALASIQPVLDKLYDQMVEEITRDGQISPTFLYEAQRIENIKKLITGEFQNYGAISQAETLRLQHMAVQLGQEAAQALLQSTVPSGVNWTFGLPSQHAIADLIGATQAGSPLAALFHGFV